MTTQPLISVVVPAYNEEKYLDVCLSSLANQTYPAHKYEVLVVNNASTDSTTTIAREWGATVIDEPMKGVARARQTGFLAARGPIIASTDADTAVSEDWLARIAAAFSRNPHLGGIYGPVYWPDGQAVERWMLEYPASWVMTITNRLRYSLWWGSNFAVSCDAFRLVGGFSTEMPSGEDTDLSLRMSRYFTIHYDPDLIAYSSARRIAKVGPVRYSYQTVEHAVRRFILQDALPEMQDFR